MSWGGRECEVEIVSEDRAWGELVEVEKPEINTAAEEPFSGGVFGV